MLGRTEKHELFRETHSERRHRQRGKHLKSRQLLESPDGCSVVSADGGGVPETVCRKADQQDSDH